MIAGPRAVKPEEFEGLGELVGAVFRPSSPHSMFQEYPQLFNAANFENLRVCVENGRCVSHVGMIEREASLFGCPIQVCCIGAVATYKEHRGQGLASACFDDAVQKAYQDGVDLMIVSGDRNLYRMRGCLRVGNGRDFHLTADSLAGLEGLPVVKLETVTEETLPQMRECYRREPARFLRPLEDYRYAWQSRFVMNQPVDFLAVQADGIFCGYIILQQPNEYKWAAIAEYAGDRRALLAALPQLFARYKVEGLGWHVPQHDTFFRALCEGTGLQGEPASTSGTYKIINFPQLMQRLRPRWEELLGREEAAKLDFSQDDDRYVFKRGRAELATDRDTATRLLFGTIEGEAAPAVEGHGALTEALKTLLPLPCLWYGINYV
ncbi:MAG TPA: GNAT family N-acetyltransferase [Chthonomonadaceae bacterium]|nr:GNAT family N-acetyltransferase [Chthonomonadaceae bacterium]